MGRAKPVKSDLEEYGKRVSRRKSEKIDERLNRELEESGMRD